MPVVESERYGPQSLNVADQLRDAGSLLNWMERLIRRRKECPEFGWGEWRVLETDEPSVIAHRCDWEGSTVVAVHNLSENPCTPTLEMDGSEELVDLFGDRHYDALGAGIFEVRLEGYGYRWFRIRRSY